MTITVQNGVARAVFTNAATASTVDCRGGITVELDSNGLLVAANYDGYSNAIRLIKSILVKYPLVLTPQDATNLLEAIPN